MKFRYLLNIALILGIASSLSYCDDKDDDATVAALGSEISADNLKYELEKVYQKYAKSAFNIKKNEFVEFDETYKVEISPSQITKSSKLQIIDRQDKETSVSITLLLEETNHENDTIVKREETVRLKQSPSSNPLKLFANIEPPLYSKLNISKTLASEEPIRTFHNLRIYDILVLAPKRWRARKNCNDCQFEAIRIDYDVALWSSDTEFDKISVQEIILKESSYFASTYKQCLTQLAPFEGKKYLIQQCPIVLRDFEYGE